MKMKHNKICGIVELRGKVNIYDKKEAKSKISIISFNFKKLKRENK